MAETAPALHTFVGAETVYFTWDFLGDNIHFLCVEFYSNLQQVKGGIYLKKYRKSGKFWLGKASNAGKVYCTVVFNDSYILSLCFLKQKKL